MKKVLCVLLAAACMLGLTACGGSRGDYPAAVMLEGTVWLVGEEIPVEIDESAILGYTQYYTGAWPRRNGETNFSRDPVPYARCGDELVILSAHEWRRCQPAE